MTKIEAEAVIKDTVEYANNEIVKNKKRYRRYIAGIVTCFVLLIAAGSFFVRMNVYANTDGNNITTVREYSRNENGTWECGGNTYRYKLEITGRMPNASADSTFVYLSNSENITLEQAWKAAGFSSSLNDYFDVRDAVLVGMS